jgi:hypothetical protein
MAAKRITKEAVEALFALFTSCGFPKKQRLPPDGALPPLDAIREKYNLTRDQLRRQLNKWKADTYNFNDAVLPDASSEIVIERLTSRLSLDPSEILVNIVSDMTPSKTRGKFDVEKHSSDQLLHLSLCRSLPQVTEFLRALMDLPNDHSMKKMLVEQFDFYVSTTANHFPTKAGRRDKAELNFSKDRLLNRYSKANEWSSIVPQSMQVEFDRPTLRLIFLRLEELLHLKWCRLMRVEDALSRVIITEVDEVDDFSAPSVYSALGWVLFEMKNSSSRNAASATIQLIAEQNCISRREAMEEKLPISEIRRKEVSELTYPSGAFFEFGKLLETNYLRNMTLDKYVAHMDGSLVVKIDETLTKSEFVFNAFKKCVDDTIQPRYVRDAYQYILKKFRNVRGSNFVKKLKGQQVDDVKDFSTRDGVAAAVLASKASALSVKAEKVLESLK